MGKKQLLFVIDSLTIGGGEKSLVTLLSLLDYSRYDVDLQLFGYGGAFERFLPQEVHLLPPLAYTRFLQKGVLAQILTFDIRKLIARWQYTLSLRMHKGLLHSDKARLYWKAVHRCIPLTKKRYDVAIAYAQGVPTMYVVDKVIANKKIGWVNVSYKLRGINRDFQHRFYHKLDVINTVSDSAFDIFSHVYPDFKSKMIIIRDIISLDFIEGMAMQEVPLSEKRTGAPIIVTAARLNKYQKGLDITLDVARLLHERGIAFYWYILGEGPFRQAMEQYIFLHGLKDSVFLLGALPNPYPYMKAADLYVQTSRHEGYGLSIAEARLLNVPVVTTEYEGVYVQMKPNRNGIVVPIDATAVADAIQDLLAHPEKRAAISGYQRQEKKGNVEEIQKFYRMIEEYD